MIRILIKSLVFIFLFSCNQKKAKTYVVEEVALATEHSGEPNLTVDHEGSVYISWIEYENDSLDALKFSKLENSEWTEPKVIAQGSDWFVNWADFPSLINVDHNRLTAHWLQKSASSTYDYDVHIAQSEDGGITWAPSIIPHRDNVNAEHGFVSLLPTPEHKTFAVWLDGRYTKRSEDNAMTLRSAEIDFSGQLSEEVELDHRVCDCCQTNATWTAKGPLVVYRDRSENEIRDISIVRKVNGEWTSPKSLFNDGWKIAGCPVNGPGIDSEGSNVAIVWFTMSNDEPKVLACLSTDYGNSFSNPIRLDEGDAIGRVDVAFVNGNPIVSWMENDNEIATINFKAIDMDGQVSEVFEVGVNSKSRSSGFPRLIEYESGMLMAWTDAHDTIHKVRTFKISK